MVCAITRADVPNLSAPSADSSAASATASSEPLPHRLGDRLRVGHVVPYDGQLWRVHHVNYCAAYIRPIHRPDAESFAIAPNSYIEVVHPIYTEGETTLMPNLRQTEAAIEEYALKEIIKPHAQKLTQMHTAIQRSTIAEEFNDDHESGVAAFANRMADGVYDAVVTVIEDALKATKAATSEPAVSAPAKPPRAAATVVYGPGKAASITGQRIVLVDSTIPTGSYAELKGGKTAPISDADYAKCVSLGLGKRQLIEAGAAAVKSVAAKKSAKKKVSALVVRTPVRR